MSGDRILGAVACAAAAAIVIEAFTFRVGFYTDPLGAGGLPLIAAALTGCGGLMLLIKPKSVASLPARTVMVRCLATASCLLAYAAALPLLGFLVATTSAIALLSVIFEGPARRAILMAAGYTICLYVLFSYVLSLPLPVGKLFVRGP